jgi:AsmA family
MKRKLLWTGGAVIALITILFIAMAVFVKSYLKGDRLKAMLIPKVESLTGRNLSVGSIDVSLLRGFVMKGISLKERDGKRDFITIDAFILDYSLMPLLERKIVIKRIDVVSPRISIVRGKDGDYNFRDLMKVARSEQQRTAEEKRKWPSFTIAADKIKIKGAEIKFSDEMREIPDVYMTSDGEVRLSLGKSGEETDFAGSLDIKELKTSLKDLRTVASGKVEINRESIRLILNALVGNDKVEIKGNLTDYLKTPNMILDIHSRELDLDRLMPIVSAKEPSRGKVKRNGASFEKAQGKAKGRTSMIRASGEIKVDAAKFTEYRIKDFNMSYAYQDGLVALKPLEFSFAGGQKVKVEGVAKGEVRFRYEPEGENAEEEIKKTASGKGVVDLRTCEVRQSAVSDAVSIFTGLPDLRNPSFDRATFDITIRDQRIFLKGLMQSKLLVVEPRGTIDFDKRIEMLADLKLSPGLSARLPAGRVTGYLKDEKGWTSIPLKIGGTVDKPSVGMNQAAMGKQLGREIKRFIEKGLAW